MIQGWSTRCEIALWYMPLDLTNDKSKLVQVVAWCHQATSHYLSQCWSRSLSPYGVIRPQWVNNQRNYEVDKFWTDSPVCINEENNTLNQYTDQKGDEKFYILLQSVLPCVEDLLISFAVCHHITVPSHLCRDLRIALLLDGLFSTFFIHTAKKIYQISALLISCEGNQLVTSGFFSQEACKVENVSIALGHQGIPHCQGVFILH